MQIIFKTPTGDTYQAELEDDKLTNITKCNASGVPMSSKPGGSAPANESEQEEQKDSKNSSEGTGGNDTRSKEDRVFIERLKAVLINNRARKQLRHRQKGLLDTRALVKTQMDSPSVFRQNNRKDSHRNYSVVLLVDESGSMKGDHKCELAQELAQSISSNLDQVGGVEVAVLGFSGNRIIEHKRFDNTGHSSLCCIASFASGRNHCSIGEQINDIHSTDGENADLIAMEYALGYLDKNHAPNSKQVFIMLSDGNPCDSTSRIAIITADLKSSTFTGKFTENISGRRTDISHMHRLLKLFPDITSFGLGMTEGGQQIPRHVVVKDLSQTKQVLLNFLRTAIT